MRENKIDLTTVLGYATGVGLVFIASFGVYWNYWQPTIPDWQWILGSFTAGALVGGLFATWRGTRL
jgi:L-asparagine transporter-like permease